MRVGLGIDIHRFAPGRRLILGGVEIPHNRGLAGHSDADALAHAVTDALLGAAGEPDIGELFPGEDDRYRDADSVGLLAQVRERLAQRGLVPAQVDAVVLAEEPRLAAYLPAMRDRLASALGLPADRVSVKATTAEGMGAIGRADGISCHAVALVVEAGDG